MSSPVQPRFARVAAAIGEPTRALMLSRLLDGRCYTATELAEHAGVAASTASQHLKVLVDEGLAQMRAQGRHRYFMLADADVAHALEALLRVADGALPETTRWQAPAMRGLRHARSCYGHLAGELGVRLCQSFVAQGWVQSQDGDGRNYVLTGEGRAALVRLGVPAAALDHAQDQNKRQLYGCVDWSERRDHFAGPLAVALLDTLVEQGWLRRSRESRELAVTAAAGLGAASQPVRRHIGPGPGYLLSVRMARSNPSIVSGNMRWFISCLMMETDWRYCHTPSGSGLSQTNLGKALVKRVSHSAPGSSLLYSTEPPACSTS
jgi:DNA-binding transcriptional ArsR family regulator